LPPALSPSTVASAPPPAGVGADAPAVTPTAASLLAVPLTNRRASWSEAARALPAAERAAFLAQVDALHASSPSAFEEVHSAYRSLAATFDPRDPADLPRIRVVLDGNSGSHPDLEAMWQRVVAHGPPTLAVEALTRLASISSLRGAIVEAEARFDEAVRRAEALGGHGMAGVLAAYASTLIGGGRDVEALVVAHEAEARSSATVGPWRRAWLAHTEAQAHLVLGDPKRARDARDRFAALVVQCGPRQRGRAAPPTARLDAELALARGDAAGALGFHDEERRAWAATIAISPRQELAWHALRVRLLVAVGRPADALAHGRAALVAWTDDDTRTLALRVETLRAALVASDGADLGPALDTAVTALASGSPSETSAADRTRLALDLAESLVAAGRDAAARRAYDAAAAASLARLVELDRFARTFPTLLRLVPAHRDALEAYRVRSADRHRALAAPLVRLLEAAVRGGHPVASLLHNEHGLTTICAWCQRVRLADGRWLTVQQFLPLAPTGEWPLTHGICEDCRPALEADLERSLARPR
ncbi:MAG: hypothetical protein JNM10_03600, partial [Planctomycetia bacterium]|nr:hypothetical protein [Planctomycetia bacterium]